MDEVLNTEYIYNSTNQSGATEAHTHTGRWHKKNFFVLGGGGV